MFETFGGNLSFVKSSGDDLVMHMVVYSPLLFQICN